MLETVIAVISGLTALVSLMFTEKQWRKINKKIAMITNAETAIEVLPAWYTARMMQDQWYFGLRTVDGHVIAIRKITAISDDGKWMDVNLLTDDEIPDCKHLSRSRKLSLHMTLLPVSTASSNRLKSLAVLAGAG